MLCNLVFISCTDLDEDEDLYQNENQKTLKNLNIYASKYPPAFKFDVHIDDLKGVFEFLKDNDKKDFEFKKMLVAQFNLKEQFIAKIDREIEHVKTGKKGYILVKLNGLEDPAMIDKLYEASQGGVRIDLIVRGICCLRPGVPGLSENIRIVRLVDRFLEHARVFSFRNDGDDELYLASADWMTRNLERRVETGFPITDPDLKAEIRHILKLQLADNTKAVRLNSEMENIPVREDAKPVRAQADTYKLVKKGKLGK